MSAFQKFVSACVLIAVAAAIALCVSGMATQHWLKVNSQFEGNVTIYHMLFKLDIDIEANTGLRECCLKTNIDVDLSRVKPIMLNMVKEFIKKMPTKTSECVHADNSTNVIDSKLSRSLKHFKYIFVCLVLGLVTMCSAFIALLVKTFFARRRKIEPTKKSSRSTVISIILMIIAAMPIAVAVFVGHFELNGEAEFVDLGITHYESKFIASLPFAPKPTGPTTAPKPTIPPTVGLVDDTADDEWDDSDDWGDDEWDDGDDWDDNEKTTITTEQSTAFESTTQLPTMKSTASTIGTTEPPSGDVRQMGVLSLKTTVSPSGGETAQPAANKTSRVRRAVPQKSSRRRHRKRHDPMKDVRRILNEGRRNIKADLEKSHSYSLVIAGLFALLMGVCGGFLELCLDHRPSTSGSDTSSNRLVVEDAFDLSEKVRMEDGSEWKILNLSDDKVHLRAA